MSFYFAIIGTKDNPIFTHEFGTSKAGGDGLSRFRDDQRHLNQFIVHSSLDIVEEVQWGSGAMYLKALDRFQNNHISAFLTGANIKFILLSNPDTHAPARTTSTSSNRASTYAAYNPTSPAVEEATKNFFLEVYDAWVKTVMNPFYQLNAPVRSPVFRARVAAAAKKFL
ncbi:Sedlin [Trichodelitschia bisporula]|uniref:Sedlin n=1 Tax=Trichodelitschia bisporula TaxID=703511 RepID=A0A6G1HPI2_9PEZI|nr:Sedlin [Trichodelitschia bisporula]